MDICPDPLPDLALLLPREAFFEILWMLRRSLPPPLSDDPAELERRDRSAMAGVASLLPVTVAEGRLAAQFASADAWARDCQRLAAERRLEPGVASKCLAQSVSLMRELRAALRELRQLQKERRKREADAEAANRAEWEERSAVGMMRGALGEAEALEPVDAAADCETESHAAISETVERRRDVGGPGSGGAGEGVDGRHEAGHDLGWGCRPRFGRCCQSGRAAGNVRDGPIAGHRKLGGLNSWGAYASCIAPTLFVKNSGAVPSGTAA